LSNIRCSRRWVIPIVRVELRRLICCTLLLGHAAGAGQSADLETASRMEDERPEVLVLLQTVQSEMMGPTALPKSPWSGYGPWGALLGLEGFAVGVMIDGVSSFAGRDSKARTLEGVQSATKLFDFEAAMLDGISALDLGANWQLFDAEQGNYIDRSAGRATRIFKETSVDYVMYIRSFYFVSPGLNQIRLIVSLRVYSRPNSKSRLKAMYTRTFEYLSPSRGDLLRPFHKGEREALIQEVETNFTELMEKYPANRKAYRKFRKNALNALNDGDVILPIMAISEGWPGTSFDDELMRATGHVFHMLKEGLLDIRPSNNSGGHMVTFNGLDSAGKPEQFEGYVFGRLDSNTAYRDEDGNYYSVP